MLGVNPRFVLRQWVLEELIAGMTKDLKVDTENGREGARSKLANILKVSFGSLDYHYSLSWIEWRVCKDQADCYRCLQIHSKFMGTIWRMVLAQLQKWRKREDCAD